PSPLFPIPTVRTLAASSRALPVLPAPRPPLEASPSVVHGQSKRPPPLPFHARARFLLEPTSRFERDGVEGQEEEPEACALAALRRPPDRRGQGFPAAGGERAEDPGEAAARGAGEHGHRPVHRPHPPRLLRGPDARSVSLSRAQRSAGGAMGLVLIQSLLVWLIFAGFFQQFGAVKRVRIARNRKTGKSKHYGFIEFENPEVSTCVGIYQIIRAHCMFVACLQIPGMFLVYQVAKIVADEMNNYLLFEHTLQIAPVPLEKVHAKLWKGVRKGFVPVDRVAIERNKLSKDKTVEEHKRMLEGIVKRDENRRKRIKAAGIDYECPPLIGSVQPSAKKIKFDED
uniref:RRM domain-containing protein n=2 Tax=Aegilops tauschii subsp. strangulata TaxID=200361 RepID=A0A453B5J6_AEGTS